MSEVNALEQRVTLRGLLGNFEPVSLGVAEGRIKYLTNR